MNEMEMGISVAWWSLLQVSLTPLHVGFCSEGNKYWDFCWLFFFPSPLSSSPAALFLTGAGAGSRAGARNAAPACSSGSNFDP